MLNRRFTASTVLLAASLALVGCAGGAAPDGGKPTEQVTKSASPAVTLTEHSTDTITLRAPDSLAPDDTVPSPSDLGLSYEDGDTRAALLVMTADADEVLDTGGPADSLQDVAELAIASMTDFQAEGYESAAFDLKGADEAYLARMSDQDVKSIDTPMHGFALVIRHGGDITVVMAGATSDYPDAVALLDVPDSVEMN